MTGSLGRNSFPCFSFRGIGSLLKISGIFSGKVRVLQTFVMKHVDLIWILFPELMFLFHTLAHIFLSFRFSDGRHVVVSLETRREVGEKFSPFLGVLRQFEIIFVVGSEQDIVGLRTDIRDERVYLYQTVASPEQARALFYQIAEDVNGIFRQPRMYNTLTYNCTNALTRRVEDISEVRFPLTWKTVLPGYFDEVLYQMGLIVPAGNFAETKNQRLIDNIRVHRQSPQYESELRRITNTPES